MRGIEKRAIFESDENLIRIHFSYYSLELFLPLLKNKTSNISQNIKHFTKVTTKIQTIFTRIPIGSYQQYHYYVVGIPSSCSSQLKGIGSSGFSIIRNQLVLQPGIYQLASTSLLGILVKIFRIFVVTFVKCLMFCEMFDVLFFGRGKNNSKLQYQKKTT